MEQTPIEKAIIELKRRTKFGSIELHFKDQEIIWIDKHRRYSPDSLIEEMSLTELPLNDKLETDK